MCEQAQELRSQIEPLVAALREIHVLASMHFTVDIENLAGVSLGLTNSGDVKP